MIDFAGLNPIFIESGQFLTEKVYEHFLKKGEGLFIQRNTATKYKVKIHHLFRFSTNCICRGVLLTWITVEQGPIVCACSRCGRGLFGHFFSHLSILFSFSLSLGDGPI